MIIQELIPSKNGKVKVCLSGGADFLLYKKEVQKLHLEEGEELTDEIYQLILTTIMIPRAKKRAMFLLEKMERSEHQLRDKLKGNGYPVEAIDEAIAYVKSYHYVDDNRLARAFIRFYQESRSKMRIKQDLMKKGISKDIIEIAIEEEYQQSEEDMIRRLMEKKKYNPENATREEQAKMYRFLASRGFKSSDISHSLKGGYLT